MKIELSDVGKRYKAEWILKRINLSIQTGKTYAVTGPNGIGKSTFLRLLSGHLSPSRGDINHFLQDRSISSTELYQHIAFAAPYIELVEEFNLLEVIRFHRRFRPQLPPPSELIALSGLPKTGKKTIQYFSSGMKQRLKLTLAICDTCPLLLLDEPSTNLDEQATAWYHDLLSKYSKDRTIIIASNIAADYQICEEEINMLDYK